MNIFKNAEQLSNFLFQKKKNGKQIGFVPTMGALHPGHLELLSQSIRHNDLTVCSIFVNPTQFNDPEDFKKYPVTIEGDIYLLELAGCNVLFLPAVSEIYPEGTNHLGKYDLGFLETVLEGKFRPGHFQGVCQVVQRLLEIVLPNTLYMGQKDYQQSLVIKKLLSMTRLDEKIKLKVLPTVREADGLAMSSRNKRLSKEARSLAPIISKTLQSIKESIRSGKTQEIIKKGVIQLESAGFKTDYLQLANAETLELIKDWDGQLKIVVLAAAFIEGIRLIDNILIN
jgi:pantoate--beta-alanine ligase